MENFIYGNEPADLKLMVLRLAKKIHLWCLTILLGALAGAGIYYMATVTFAEKASYQSGSDFYFTFAQSSPGVDYVYYNESTWKNLIYTDVFMQTALDQMKMESDLSQLKAAVTLRPMTDVRMLTTVVTTTDPALSLDMAQALEIAFQDYIASHQEFTGMEILTHATDAARVTISLKTGYAALAGGILAGFLWILIWMIAFVLDDSVYVQSVIEKRYHVTALGTVFGCKSQAEEQEYISSHYGSRLLQSLDYLAQGSYDKIYLLPLIAGSGAGYLARILEKTGRNVSSQMAVIGQTPDYDLLRKSKGVILVVPAGGHNGKKIELAISQLKQQDCILCGVILNKAEKKLTRRYYKCLAGTEMKA